MPSADRAPTSTNERPARAEPAVRLLGAYRAEPAVRLLGAYRAEPALRLLRQGRREQLAELAELVAFRSVSAERACARQVRRCARHLAATLARLPLPDVRLLETGGPPLVVGRTRWRPGLPSLLVYAHYDVQPAPPPGWRTPPFAATRAGSAIAGRGVADNKGPLLAHVWAARALLAGGDPLPVNLTYVFDGEEEVGSPHLPGALARLRLPADLVVVSDTRMLGPCRPALVHALRGSVNLRVEVPGNGARHAGEPGGHNPAHVLADLLSTLHDAHGRIAVPGFRNGASDETRPAINVTRLGAGNAATAIPAAATAWLNLRLVPGQRPGAAVAALRTHLTRAAPQVRLRVRSASPAVLTSTDPDVLRPAAEAYVRGFGRAPVLTRSGGSIPAVGHLQDALGAPVVLMGFMLPDDRIHAPNERMRLPVLWRAADTCVWLLSLLPEIHPIGGVY
jgi:acetylornithine deacetylase/succinyl-diaminopimelate desuccinylase-like protein